MRECCSRRRFWRGVGLAAAGVTALSVSPAAAAGRAVTSLAELRRQHVVLQNYDISCAAAALATVLNYQHGERLTEREIALALINRPEYVERPELVRIRQGFSLLDLKRYVESRGYEGIGYGQLRFADLADLAPLIVPIDSNGYNHFIVYRGAFGDSVLGADPAYGNRTMSRARFERAWPPVGELGRVGFVVQRRDGLIPPNRLTAEPDDFLVLRP